MTKEQVLIKLYEMANNLKGNYDIFKEMEISNLANEYGIEMYEHCNENYEVDGFYIEDDYWLYKDLY